jgi:hypothetical protein
VRRVVVVVVTAACLAGLLTACGSDTVRVSYRPPPGARYRHEVRVHSVTTTRLAGTAEDRAVDDLVLVTEQTVLAADAGGVRVQVRLRQAGAPDRTFVVRLDHAAQLAGVETVEGLPPSVLGADALPQILPGAAGAPPDRPLGPGERWTIDAPAALPGVVGARLQGSGRLVELGLSGGRKVASTRSSTRLPLSATTPLRGSVVALDGIETTDGTATRALVDGAVERATTVTHGQFRLTLGPVGTPGATPVGGTLTLEVRSETRRLGG